MEKINLKYHDPYGWHAEKDGWMLPIQNVVNNFDIYIDEKGEEISELELLRSRCETLEAILNNPTYTDSAWYEKLAALMEGLEIQNVERFMKHAQRHDYRDLGEHMARQFKNKTIRFNG